MQAAGDDFLAHAGFAQQQYRGLAGSGLVDQCAGLSVDCRLADAIELTGTQLHLLVHLFDLLLQRVQLVDDGVAVEIAQELVGVIPFFCRLADDAAGCISAAAAADFAVDDLAADEMRGVADGIAQQHPAHRLLGMELLALVVLHFEGVLPLDIGVEGPGLQVDVHLAHHHLDHALERMQLRADQEHVDIAGVGPQLARKFRVLEPRLVAQAQEKAFGALLADHFDQLAPARGHGRHLHQQHALFVQPDLALAAQKTDPVGEVLELRGMFRGSVFHVHASKPLVCFGMGGTADGPLRQAAGNHRVGICSRRSSVPTSAIKRPERRAMSMLCHLLKPVGSD
ncbi:hypothetical protein D9M71_295370 [compost metagenome]